jgi:hypothetical protein
MHLLGRPSAGEEAVPDAFHLVKPFDVVDKVD